jgi:hypothetical protein
MGFVGGIRVRRLPIRFKLAVTLAVPLIILVALTGVEVAGVVDDASRVQEQTDLATAALGPDGLIEAIQSETEAAGAALTGLGEVVDAPDGSIQESWSRTDRAVEQFTELVNEGGPTVRETYQPSLQALGALEAVRASIEGYDRPRRLDSGVELASQLYRGYSVMVRSLLDDNAWAARSIDDAVLRRGNELITIAIRQRSTTSDITWNLLLTDRASDRSRVDTGGPTLVQMLGDYDSGLRQIRAIGRGAYADPAHDVVTHESIRQFRSLVDDAVGRGNVADDDALRAAGETQWTTAYAPLRDSVADVLVDRADMLNADAAARERVFVLMAAGVLLAAILATWLVSRSITRPLRTLTTQAVDMAGRRLPEAVTEILAKPLGEDVTLPEVVPVPTTTRDEVADVAEALNTVQSSAIDLAVEQAVLRRNIADSFVNLGRRNQNLLARQIDFITELESGEADADVLASLFRLDHLATRMRRNAESLLVLASAEPPRRWTAPVRLTDVVR